MTEGTRVLEVGADGPAAGWTDVAVCLRDRGIEGVLSRRTGLVPDRPSPVPVWIRVAFGAVSEASVAVWPGRGVLAVDWMDPSDDPVQARRLLVAAARAGLWNRVFLSSGSGADALASWLADNPNLVPSWNEEAWTGVGGYAGLPPVTGRPLAKTLSDVDLLLELGRLGSRSVRRARMLDDGARVTLGDDLAYRFVPPVDVDPQDLDDVCRLVMAGGAVHEKWLRHNLERAHLLALVEERGALAGFSSLKHPRPEYVERIRSKLGLDITDYLERGYTSVRPEYRGLGLGTRLLEGLTKRAVDRNIYSIIRDADRATQTIARRNGTVRVAGFMSEVMGEAIGLWMPEATAQKLGLEQGDWNMECGEGGASIDNRRGSTHDG